MNRIIKITDDEIFIGTENGSIVKAARSSASWDVQIGDKVEIFSNGKNVILTPVKKAKVKQDNGLKNKTVGLCQKIFPIVFSCLFVAFFIAFIVICSVPRGKNYYFKTPYGIEIEVSVSFTKDDLTLKMTNLYADEDDDPYTINVRKYKIDDGDLYIFDELTEKYENVGEITSTKLILIEELYGAKYVFPLENSTMISLKTWSLVLMIVSAVLDLACIAVLVLTKKGIIEYAKEEKQNVMAYVQPLNVPHEPMVSVSEEQVEEKPIKIEEVIAEVPTEVQEEPAAKNKEKKVIKVNPKDPSDLTIKDMLSKLNGELDDND